MHVWSKDNKEVLFDLESVKNSLPKFPWDKKLSFQEAYKLSSKEANLLIRDENVANYYEKLAQEFKALNVEPQMLERLNKLAYNYLASDLVGLATLYSTTLNEKFVSLQNFKNLIVALASEKINSASAKKILTIIADINNKEWEKEGIDSLLNEYTQNNDEAVLLTVVGEVLAKNVKAVSEYKAGKVTVIQFLLGQAMAITHGKASPEVLKKLLEQKLRK